MKALGVSLGVAAAIVLGANVASAAGIVQYTAIVNPATFMEVDLGGQLAAIPDLTTTWNDYDGAATLPNGVPVNYSIHIDRTFVGDGNAATDDHLEDWYLFKLDAASLPPGSLTASGNLAVTFVWGWDTGIENASFGLYKAQAANAEDRIMPALAFQGGTGAVDVFLDPGVNYMLTVTGHLSMDNPMTGYNESTNAGRYDIVMGLQSVSAVPVPPALLLLLTGIGALFGFRGSRMFKSTATA